MKIMKGRGIKADTSKTFCSASSNLQMYFEQTERKLPLLAHGFPTCQRNCDYHQLILTDIELLWDSNSAKIHVSLVRPFAFSDLWNWFLHERFIYLDPWYSQNLTDSQEFGMMVLNYLQLITLKPKIQNWQHYVKLLILEAGLRHQLYN